MSAIRSRLALVSLPLVAGALAACAALPAVRGQDGASAPAPPARGEIVAEARQILQKRCFACHGEKPDDLEAEMNIFDRAALVERKLVVPGKPDGSKLIKRVTSERTPMPPKPRERVPDSEVQILRDWISAGAPALTEAVATAKATAPPPPPAAPPKSPADRARQIFEDQCAQCHGGAKPEADFRVIDREALLSKGLVVASEPDKSELLKRIIAPTDRMPPEGGGRRALTPDEVAAVRAWIQGGAPAFEPTVRAAAGQLGDEYVLQSILADVRKLAGANERLESYRYFSLNHLLAGGITAADVEANRQALTLIVNHLSRKKEFVIPQPIEPTGTVFRLDISQLGWDRQPLQPKSGSGDGLTLFDVVLLDYPYGLIYDGSATYRQLVTEYLTPIHQVRPVAFVRADWFVNTAARPPLYEDLLQLPATFEALQKQLGVDVADDLKNFRSRRAGFTHSNVSRNNRIVERHEPDNSAYLWVSYDYRSNKGTDNIFQDPVHLNPTGGEMIFGLPNGLQGFYVANGKGTRLEAAPTEIVTDKFASDQTVRNGLACMRCHGSNGMKLFRDDVRPVLLQMSGGTVAFDRQEALRLYPAQAEIDRLRDRDAGTFRRSLDRLFAGKPVDVGDVLDRVSKRFLDTPLNINVAAEELAVGGPGQIEKSFQNRALTAVGLMELASGGTIRRDTWEDDYDQVAEQFGRGVAVVPIDGVTRSEYQRPESRITFTVSTNRQTVKAGDVLVVTLKNTSSLPIFVELVGTGTEGQKAVLTPEVVSVAAGDTLKKGFKVNAITGKDQMTVYASDAKFEKGELFVLPDADRDKGLGMGSRFVHRRFFQLPAAGGRLRPDFDPTRMVKKTVEIETQ